MTLPRRELVGGPIELPLPREEDRPGSDRRLSHAGWRVVMRKELADHLTSIRPLLVLLVLGLAGVGILISVSATIRDVAAQASESRGVFLALFTMNPSTSLATAQLPSMVALTGFIAPLLGIVLGFDSISSERTDATLSRLLSQPIHRDAVINGKFAARLAVIALILGTIVLVVGGVGIWRLAVTPELDDLLRIATWYLLTVVYVGFWLALATLASVVFRRAATAALVVLSTWLVLTFFGAMIIDVVAGVFASSGSLDWYRVRQVIEAFVPQTLYSTIATAVMDPAVRTVDVVGSTMLRLDQRALPTVLPFEQSLLVVWGHIAMLVAGSILSFALAYVVFMRQEVRA